jgi:hypothetical protein
MRINTIAAILLPVVLLATPASAQPVGGVIGASPDSGDGFIESAIASCAGGAAIGYLAALATGVPSPGGTAALFCGLSVAATTASTVAVGTWHLITSPFR